ncbi:MAG: LysE family translocator [Aeromonas sp.]
MDVTVGSALLTFALITCGTPGPNNLLLTCAGAAHGVRRSLPLLLAVVAGISGLMLAMALGLGALFVTWPALQVGLKLLGSVYLLWLALGIARSQAPQFAARPLIGAKQGALLQLLNPKAWLMAMSAISSFTAPGAAYWPAALVVLAVFFVIGLATGGFWLLLGARVQRFICTDSGWQRFNYSMGAATALCVLMLWY